MVYDKRKDDEPDGPSFADIVVKRDQVVAFESNVGLHTQHRMM